MARVIALVDMDCFYVQVEQRLNPSLYGKPCAVVQYNDYRGGGIIAVGYEARKYGVTRGGMRGDDAKERCPDINLCHVPVSRGKADLTRYREAGAEVIAVLKTFSNVCERASVDEAYLDLTEEVQKSVDSMSLEEIAEETLKCSHIVGFTDQDISDQNHVKGQWIAALSDHNNRHLAMGAIIVQRARNAVREKTQFTCSAGIAHNKMLAKLAGGSHKPNQQTLLIQASVPTFYQTIPISKVRHFGGKFGKAVINSLQVEKMSEIAQFSKDQLQKLFGEKSGTWLYYVAQGIENETVQSRELAKSTGCGKNFLGKLKLISKTKIAHWMLQLSSELCDRLKGEEIRNHRTANLVSVGLRLDNGSSGVRSFPLKTKPDPQAISDTAMHIIKPFNTGTGDIWKPGIIGLSLNASKFEETSKGRTSSIANFFGKKGDDNNDKNVEEKSGISHDHQNDLIDSGLTNKETEKQEELATSSTSSNKGQHSIQPCVSTTQKPKRNTSLCNYKPSEIDQSILNELPDDLKSEIEQILAPSKISEKKKRSLNGIQKYTLSETKVSERRKDSCEGQIVCDKCGEVLTQSNQREHQDYHFAMELQKEGELAIRNSPPKKRHKNTIDSFFLSK